MVAAMVWCAALGSHLAWIDIRTHRLPNRLVLRLGAGLWLMLSVWLAVVAASDPPAADGPNMAAVWFTAILALGMGVWSASSPRAVGMGDAKLLLALAPMFAVADVTSELAAAWLVSTAAVVVIWLRRLLIGVPVGAPLAYGPFLLASAPLALALSGAM